VLEDLKSGKMIIVVDDPDRENEGDLIMAAEACTPEAMNFMIKFGGGVPFIPTTAERLQELGIPMMTKQNSARLGTAMAETVDALHGTTTGVSAYDRTRTVEVFCDPDAKPEDLGRPGHIIPIRAEKGGVLKRAGHTEASVDLAILAGFKPVAVGCEILADDGTMMRLEELLGFAEEHELKIITIADLIAYRRKNEKLVKRAGSNRFPDEVRKLHTLRIRDDGRATSLRCNREGRCLHRRSGSGARALQLSNGRSSRIAAMRLR